MESNHNTKPTTVTTVRDLKEYLKDLSDDINLSIGTENSVAINHKKDNEHSELSFGAVSKQHRTRQDFPLSLSTSQNGSSTLRGGWSFNINKFQKQRDERVVWHVAEEFLSHDECDRIIELGSQIKAFESRIKWGVKEEQERKTDIFWISPNLDTVDLMLKILEYAADVNNEKFGYDLYGNIDNFQLGRYGIGHGYNWHIDLGQGQLSKRKLSLSLQLSDPDDYEGGDLQFFYNENHKPSIPRTRGTITIFPSWMTHRVTEVTAGERWSLVNWLIGPPLR